MRRGTLLLVPLFSLAAASACAMAILPDIVWLAKFSDATAEVVVMGSRLHTFQVHGETRICGWSYDIAIREVVTGRIAGRRFSVGERVWYESQTTLGSFSRDVVIGATYFVGLDAKPGYRDPKRYAKDLASTWKMAAFRACLKTLPRDEIGTVMRVYRGDGSSGAPAKGRTYLRVPTDESIEDAAVFGSFTAERYSDKPDISEVPLHDMAVDYGTFKRFMRDPDYHSAGRGSLVIP